MKKLGLLLASMVLVFALNAQTPEKKECCKDKAKTECASKEKKECDKSKDESCSKDAKKDCPKSAETKGKSDKKNKK